MKPNYNYRHENKFIINYAQKICIENSINGILQKDNHLKNDTYNIRSIYFDDYAHSCYFENENGTDPREKFRIRIYDCNENFIRLELKKKRKLMTLKEKCVISKNQLEDIINGLPLKNFSDLDPLLKKFEMQRQMKFLKPDVIVEYDRLPYIYNLGNVRITFDMNLTSSNDFNNFFLPQNKKRAVFSNNMLVLEVKFDEFLPEYIENIIYPFMHQRTSFSKFYMCRHFSFMGI